MHTSHKTGIYSQTHTATVNSTLQAETQPKGPVDLLRCFHFVNSVTVTLNRCVHRARLTELKTASERTIFQGGLCCYCRWMKGSGVCYTSSSSDFLLSWKEAVLPSPLPTLSTDVRLHSIGQRSSASGSSARSCHLRSCCVVIWPGGKSCVEGRR